MVSLIAFELLLRNIPNDYSIKKEYLDAKSDNIEILILGSSHTFRGVNPEFINGHAYNAAMLSQSLDYDYGILKKFDGNWGGLKTVVIPISYFSLYSNLKNGVESWRIKNYNIYFNIYGGGDWRYLTETFSTPSKLNVSKIFDYYIFNINNVESSKLGWGSRKATLKPGNLEDLGKKAAVRHTKDSNKLVASNLKILKKILILAESRNWNILFITPPAYKSYKKYLNHIQLNNTLDNISKLSLHKENVRYYNLIDSPEFIKEDFYDADHLNGKGVVKFSKILNNLIEKDFN